MAHIHSSSSDDLKWSLTCGNIINMGTNIIKWTNGHDDLTLGTKQTRRRHKFLCRNVKSSDTCIGGSRYVVIRVQRRTTRYWRSILYDMCEQWQNICALYVIMTNPIGSKLRFGTGGVTYKQCDIIWQVSKYIAHITNNAIQNGGPVATNTYHSPMRSNAQLKAHHHNQNLAHITIIRLIQKNKRY